MSSGRAMAPRWHIPAVSRTAGSRNSSGDDWHAGSNVGTAGAGADTKPDWRATQALGASPESVSSIKGRDPPGGGRLTDYVSSLRSGPRRSADDLTTDTHRTQYRSLAASNSRSGKQAAASMRWLR